VTSLPTPPSQDETAPLESQPPLARAAASGAIRRQRLENARALNGMRVILLVFPLLAFVIFGRIVDLDEWRGGDLVLFGHLLGAVLLWWFARKSERFALASAYALALLDVPAFALLEYVLLASAPNPAELVSFETATMMIVVAAAALWMNVRPIAAAGLTAAMFQGGLQLLIGGHPTIFVSTALVFGAHATVCGYGAVRLRRLVEKAAVGTLELRRAEESLIHERERLEQKLRAYQANFHQLMEDWPDASFIHRDGRVGRASRQFSNWLGFGETELTGKPVSEFVHPDDLSRLQEHQQSLVPTEVRFLSPNGRSYPAELSSRSVSLEGTAHMLTVARDLTERRALQVQLMAADRMASMGLLAAGVAHEINTPLAVIAANLAHLESATIRSRTSGQPSPEHDEALADAIEATRRVREIVGDLRLFSRGDEDQRRAVSVREALESALRLAWNEIRHRARLDCEFGPVPDVLASESRLGQVFLNLLTNATHAIPEGKLESNQITVRAGTDPSGWAVVEVKDTGSGIPPELRERVFDPFFTTKPVGVGTGLGLSICRRIVGDIGGRIEITSELGRGSSFRVLMPPTDSPREAPATVPAHSGSSRGRVLVVDDDPAICRTVKRVLGSEHDVTAMTHAEEALTELAKEAYDLVLCDLMMPVMTGLEFFARLELLAPERANRVVFLSGGALSVEARALAERMPGRFVEKPFDVHALRALVSHRVAEARRQRSIQPWSEGAAKNAS
jgi:PAS domain S-box-containing protein